MNVSSKVNTSLSISAVDLFCGVGGLTHGLQKAGINVIKGIDVDPTCKYAYEKNNKARFIEKDISEVTGNEISLLYPEGDVKLLVGCAPCQPFSSYTKKYKNRHLDEKWNLLDEFGRLVEEVNPHLIVFENVAPIRKEKVYTKFIDKLKELNYQFDQDPELVYCPDYGIPQKRRRLVIIASICSEVELSPKTHSRIPKKGLTSYKTVRQTIEHLPPIAAGEEDANDRLHRSRNLSKKIRSG